MKYRNKNFCRKPAEELQDGDIVLDSNLVQEKPHTKLACFGRKIKFVNCNVARVETWPDAEFLQCSHVGFHDPIEPDPVIDPEEELGYELQRLTKEYGEEVVKRVVKKDLKLTEVGARNVPIL